MHIVPLTEPEQGPPGEVDENDHVPLVAPEAGAVEPPEAQRQRREGQWRDRPAPARPETPIIGGGHGDAATRDERHRREEQQRADEGQRARQEAVGQRQHRRVRHRSRHRDRQEEQGQRPARRDPCEAEGARRRVPERQQGQRGQQQFGGEGRGGRERLHTHPGQDEAERATVARRDEGRSLPLDRAGAVAAGRPGARRNRDLDAIGAGRRRHGGGRGRIPGAIQDYRARTRRQRALLQEQGQAIAPRCGERHADRPLRAHPDECARGVALQSIDPAHGHTGGRTVDREVEACLRRAPQPDDREGHPERQQGQDRRLGQQPAPRHRRQSRG